MMLKNEASLPEREAVTKSSAWVSVGVKLSYASLTFERNG